MGTVYRPFKEKTPDYRDDEVKEFLLRRGEDPTTYENYMVVPKTLALATKSILRYNKPPDPLDPEVKRKYNIAFDWLDRRFTPILSNSVVFDGPTAIELMPVKKSPGYPWSLEYQYKEDFYGTPEGEEFLEKYWELLATSDYIRSLASVSVKEEVRSTDKVMRQGKARTVMAFPVPHSHASKRLFRDQNRTLITQHGKLGSEVGIDPFHGGWHELVERHLKFTARRAGSAAMDGIEYDARFRYFIGKAIGRQRFKWLRRDFRTPENLQRIRNLYYDIFHAPIVGVDGEVHSRGTGNGSGQDSTTEDNGFKNFCDFVVMYLILVPEEYQDYDSFTEFVLLSFNGDDMNFSVKEKIQPWFNPKTIMAVSKAIGMEYTCEFEDYRLFTELSFIGHTSVLTNIPRFGHAMWLPIIDCSRMRSSMYIYNEDHNVYTSIVRACGLRNETFACKSCRVWFQDLIDFLRIRHGTSTDPAIVEAWKCYLYDWELWELYSGLKAEDVRVPHSGKALPRLNTNAPPQTTMPSSKKKKHVSIKKTTSSKKKASSSKKKAPYKRNSVLDGAAISASTAIVKEAATTVKQDAAISVRKDIEDVRAARAWIASLKEPNKYSPPCIGKGSLMVTNVTVMDLTCGSNGTAAAFLIPRGQNEIMLADGTLGPITAGTWTAYAGTQDSTLSTNYQTGRFAGMSIEWESRTSTDERPGWVNAGLLFGISNTTDITGLSGNMIMNLNGMLAYNGKSAYDGAVSWRPKDGSDGEYNISCVNSSSSFLGTQIPIVYFSEWVVGAPIRLTFTVYTECLPKNDRVQATRIMANPTNHDWGAVFDMVCDLGGNTLRSVVRLGAATAAKWAAGKYLGGHAGGLAATQAASSDPYSDNFSGDDWWSTYFGGPVAPRRKLAKAIADLSSVPEPSGGWWCVDVLEEDITPPVLMARLELIESKLGIERPKRIPRNQQKLLLRGPQVEGTSTSSRSLKSGETTTSTIDSTGDPATDPETWALFQEFLRSRKPRKLLRPAAVSMTVEDVDDHDYDDTLAMAGPATPSAENGRNSRSSSQKK